MAPILPYMYRKQAIIVTTLHVQKTCHYCHYPTCTGDMPLLSLPYMYRRHAIIVITLHVQETSHYCHYPTCTGDMPLLSLPYMYMYIYCSIALWKWREHECLKYTHSPKLLISLHIIDSKRLHCTMKIVSIFL